MAIMSRPTEQTLVMASSFSMFRKPDVAAASMLESSETGMKAPERPPTEEEAKDPPFFTASLSMARTAVLPGAPMTERPQLWNISPTESPTAGVGARDGSATPKGMPSRSATSLPMISPTRVTL